MRNKHLIRPDVISAMLAANGYSVVHETKKKQAFKKGDIPPLYVNLTSSEGISAVVLHPDESTRRGQLDAIEGVAVGNTTYHSSNLRLFPKRQHKGKSEIGYGIPVEFESEAAFRSFLSAYEQRGIPATAPVTRDPELTPTSRETTADARIGQDAFRDQLLRYWKTCAVTGIESALLLRASHIKPWREASDDERRSCPGTWCKKRQQKRSAGHRISGLAGVHVRLRPQAG
jgi:hypothetical protein